VCAKARGGADRALILLTLAVMALPTLASARTSPCANTSIPADQRIGICTAQIQSDAGKPNQLVADYDNRALAYLDKGLNDNAIADENRSLAIRDHSNGHITRGGAYSHKGQYDQAIADYTRALALPADTVTPLEADGHAMAYNDRGTTYGEMGHYDRAIADFSQAIALAPRYVDPYTNRALANERVGSKDRAVADYRTALAIEPRNAKALAGLARLGVKP
jgi:tetratricopeptide (TPR) repeat protein